MVAHNDKASLLSDPERRAKRRNHQFRKAKKKKSELPEPAQFHFVDLNPETEATQTAARRRKVRLGAIIAACMIVSLGLASLFKLVWKEAFLNGSAFQLRQIAVVTQGPLGAEEIVTQSGLHDGMNMLMISLANVRHLVEALPQVKSARVERSYPGLITITVRQREPVAWLECPQQSVPAKSRGVYCMLDENGCVMPQYDGASASRELPIIHVDSLKRIIPGEPVRSEAVTAAIKLLRAHEASALSQSMSIRRVDSSKGYALKAEYDSALTVAFPRYDVEKQMRRLEEIVHHARSEGKEPATVNLVVENYVPVTYQKPSEGPVAATAPATGGKALAQNN